MAEMSDPVCTPELLVWPGMVLLLVRSILCMFRLPAALTGLEFLGLSWGEECRLLPMPLLLQQIEVMNLDNMAELKSTSRR